MHHGIMIISHMMEMQNGNKNIPKEITYDIRFGAEKITLSY